MNQKISLLLFSVFTCFASISVNSFAVSTVDISFTVQADPGDPVYGGEIANGMISFDASFLPSGAFGYNFYSAGEPLLSVDFTWAGVVWTTADLRLTELENNADGNLRSWGINGIKSGVGGISVGDFPDIRIFGHPVGSEFLYVGIHTAFNQGIQEGEVLGWEAVVQPVPIPAPLPMFLLAMAILKRSWNGAK